MMRHWLLTAAESNKPTATGFVYDQSALKALYDAAKRQIGCKGSICGYMSPDIFGRDDGDKVSHLVNDCFLDENVLSVSLLCSHTMFGHELYRLLERNKQDVRICPTVRARLEPGTTRVMSDLELISFDCYPANR